MAVVGVLDGLEGLHQVAHTQGARLAHGPPQRCVEVEHCLHVVLHSVRQDEALKKADAQNKSVAVLPIVQTQVNFKFLINLQG